MLNRLHRQDLEEVVMGYEAYRTALQRELENQLEAKSRPATITENVETKV
jgi:hypothetical protein